MIPLIQKNKVIERLQYFENLLEKTLLPLLEDYVKHKESAKVFCFVSEFLETHDEFSELLNTAPVCVIQSSVEKSTALYCYLVLLAKLLEEKDIFTKNRLSLDERRFFKDKDCQINLTKMSKNIC